MTVIIERADDPRIGIFKTLRDRDLQKEGLFITEGRFLTERLIVSDYKIRAVLAAERMCSIFSGLADFLPLYEADDRIIAEIAGFPFHRGVLAAAERKRPLTAEELADSLKDKDNWKIAVCPDSNSPENLGGIMRTAAALGYDGVLLGEKSCDYMGRKCLRAGMGAQFTLPVARSENMEEDLDRLRYAGGVSVIASVLSPEAHDLRDVRIKGKRVLLFGGEAEGLPETLLRPGDLRVSIPMHGGMDSLNLSVAAGIFMYMFR